MGGDWAVMGGGGDHQFLIPMFSPFPGPSSIVSSFSILSNLLKWLGNAWPWPKGGEQTPKNTEVSLTLPIVLQPPTSSQIQLPLPVSCIPSQETPVSLRMHTAFFFFKSHKQEHATHTVWSLFLHLTVYLWDHFKSVHKEGPYFLMVIMFHCVDSP